MARQRPNPVAWAILAGLVLLVILIIRAVVGGGSDYPGKATAVATDSAGLGRDVASLRTRVGDLDRIQLIRQLRAWARAADDHVAAATELDAPEEYALAHGYLVAALGLRAEALDRYDPAVQNALSDRDAEVAVSQLVAVMQDLVSADRMLELFRRVWPGDPKPAESKWIGDPREEAGLDGVNTFVGELRDQPALEEIYNLKVTSISVTPKPSAKENDVDLLPYSEQISMSVVITNDGNQRIPAAPVVAILKSETDPRPRTVEGRIDSPMSPGAKRTVSLRGLEPTSGGPLNLLSVTVGPVAGERNTIDNTMEYKFAMRRP